MSEKFNTDNDGIRKVSQIVISEIEKNLDRYNIKNINETSVMFLAGAPGSGKTEFIKSLPKKLDFFFIDIDSYREYFSGYSGNNSKNFQKGISGVVDKIVKYCFKNDIKFILDGTFKSLLHAKRNLENCKKKKRKVEIYFIYQNPYVSYYYTFLRELDQKRNIPVKGFVECFYNSIENIFYIKNKHSGVKLYICEKISKNGKIFGKKDYKIYDNINSLTNFCNSYNVGHNGKIFINYNILEKGIDNYNKNLKIISPFLRLYLFLKKSKND